MRTNPDGDRAQERTTGTYGQEISTEKKKKEGEQSPNGRKAYEGGTVIGAPKKPEGKRKRKNNKVR